MKPRFRNYRSGAVADVITLWLRLAAMMTFSALAGCSNSEAPGSSLSLAPAYDLRSINGVLLPISDPAGGFIDSGRVRRLGGDTVRTERYSHSQPPNGLPGTRIIALDTWLAAQSGNAIVLHPLSASTVDTLFVGHGDTLTGHTRLGIELYVGP
jgi:hypothetical protein